MDTNKKAPFIIGIIVILVAVGIVLAQRSPKKEEVVLETPSVVTPPSKTETPQATTPTEPDGYTLATVASHNTPSDCWTAVNGSVYDVTAWISKHPGGKQAIIGTCGKDSSAYFNGQHGGQPQPVSVLATFKIGALIK